MEKPRARLHGIGKRYAETKRFKTWKHDFKVIRNGNVYKYIYIYMCVYNYFLLFGDLSNNINQ